MGAYGNQRIKTPSLDSLASRSLRFKRHYAGGFPTMPARADHMTGRWTMSFMGWEPLPQSVKTLPQIFFVPVQRVILIAERSFEPGARWPREKLEPPASLKAPRTLSFLLPMHRSAKEKGLSASLKGVPPILDDEWSDNMRCLPGGLESFPNRPRASP